MSTKTKFDVIRASSLHELAEKLNTLAECYNRVSVKYIEKTAVSQYSVGEDKFTEYGYEAFIEIQYEEV